MLEAAINKLSKNCNREKLIELICEAGLVDDSRLNYREYEPYRAGKGEGLYQKPDQMADFLLFLNKFKIKSWVEIGTFNGWHAAFVTSYLRLNNPYLESHTMDVMKKTKRLKDKEYGINFHTRDSNYLKGTQFDLVYIDGCHKRKSIIKDYNNLGIHAKICAFHDIDDNITKDAKDTYKEIVKNKWHKEFTSNRIMGIGVTFQKCFL